MDFVADAVGFQVFGEVFGIRWRRLEVAGISMFSGAGHGAVEDRLERLVGRLSGFEGEVVAEDG